MKKMALAGVGFSAFSAGLLGNTRGFRGDLDELFIADRSLEPREIVSLMVENRLPSATLAAQR